MPKNLRERLRKIKPKKNLILPKSRIKKISETSKKQVAYKALKAKKNLEY